MSPPPVAEAERTRRPRSAVPATLAGAGRSPAPYRACRSVGAGRSARLAGRHLPSRTCWSSCPLAALVSHAFSGGWGSFWAAVTQPEAVAALELTLRPSLAVAAFNAGGRPGHRLGAGPRRLPRQGASSTRVIDLPFALPTIVAGLTLLTLYGPNSPFHVNVADPSGASSSRWPS